ncbi:MFS transporter [Streptomyces sp. 1331.2]|uniref:MFS transporter n=1 Tax=Streptomyces sp. 1331.2 TaxID=1938835 RepID=UPI000BD4065A|nr:MFS transporter [Streptomyces sp. 1331.2]SOB81326.1 drug resistance transporter, EmrB/QacA subfamily [Streptomyces sp. 1331.2]
MVELGKGEVPARAVHTKPAGSRSWIALAVVLTAAFMQLIDVSIVNVAVAAIQNGLGASYSQIQWVLAGYTLAFAVLLMAGGRLGDRAGRKRIFLVGMIAFTAASLLCGAAGSAELLVVARLLQGLAAALMYPQVYSVIQATVPPERRGVVLGILGGIIGLAAITGPLVGGLLIQADLFGWGWRPIFLVNVPVGILAVLLALRYLPESRVENPGAVDLPGVLLVTASLALIVYPLVQGRELDWPKWLFALMGAGVALLLLFAVYEQYRARSGSSPLVRMSLFRNRSFTGGLVVVILFYGAFLPFFLVFSLYVQAGLGYTALQAGVALVPYALGSAIGSGTSIALAPRLGRPILHLGLALLILGTGATIWVVHRWGTDLHTLQLLPSLVLSGIGFGLTVTPLVTLVLAKVPLDQAGAASGALTTAQQIGSAVGIAVLGTFFFGLLGSHADSVTEAQVPKLKRELVVLKLDESVADRMIQQYRACFHDRANEKDPAAVPASCQAESNPPGGSSQIQLAAKVADVLQAEATRDLRTDFAEAAERTLFLQVGLFVACFLLVFALPRVRGQELSEFEERSRDTVIIG